jgi:hypothetical protein
MLNNSKAAWIVAAIMAAISLKLMLTSDETVAKTFCAYNRVFVEFEEHGSRWGVLMLDWEGHPIPCSEDRSVIDKKDKQGKQYDKSI